ncbi:MAG: RNA-binding protein [Anaerolineae bacterium]
MTYKLYIGNLPLNLNPAGIRDLFLQAGTVTDVYLSTNRFTSKSNGFGFVEMATEKAGLQAITLFHGYSIAGRLLTVQAVAHKDAKWSGGANTVVYHKFPVEKVESDDTPV